MSADSSGLRDTAKWKEDNGVLPPVIEELRDMTPSVSLAFDAAKVAR